MGPQCISLFDTAGNHVIRYNECFSDLDHMYNDVIGAGRIVKHTVSRNNILHVRSPRDYSASSNRRNIENDFDYDLYNGRVPADEEAHGVRGEPIYVSDAGFDPATKTGRFQLAPDSP